MQSELSRRGQVVRDFIQSDLGMASQVNVTLKSFPAAGGKIKISTITPGTLPWSGIYFNGNPLGLTAIANDGYEFSHWDSNSIMRSIDTSAYINLNIDRDVTFTAVFKKSASNNLDYPATTDNFFVYPNPNKGNFNVYFNNVADGNYSIQVINSLGQKIYATTAMVQNRKAIKNISINNLAGGMYTIKITNGSLQKNIKIIINH
jgi:hypothetical protein